MNDKQDGGIVIDNVGGDLSFQAGGGHRGRQQDDHQQHHPAHRQGADHNSLQVPRLLDIVDRDIFYGRDTIIEELRSPGSAPPGSLPTEAGRDRAAAPGC
jgi:hypothetical protein